MREIREGPAARNFDYRQKILARLRARASVAVARYTAMRLDTYVPLPARVYAQQSYVPSDLNFTWAFAEVLTGIPIAPSFSNGG